LDDVLTRGKGICFDYAALMTGMLRSQGIPTKLVLGYAGEVYHAWITVYSEETGWIANIITFDGHTWNLMDPTFTATGGQGSNVLQFIGDGSNYSALFLF
jgi:transglutaminase-like putative cysteine protease